MYVSTKSPARAIIDTVEAVHATLAMAIMVATAVTIAGKVVVGAGPVLSDAGEAVGSYASSAWDSVTSWFGSSEPAATVIELKPVDLRNIYRRPFPAGVIREAGTAWASKGPEMTENVEPPHAMAGE